MPKLSIARRAKLVGFVALASAMILNGSSAQPNAALGKVHIDVTSLRAEVGDPTASWVSEELPGAVAQALASVGRAGVPVTVRIRTVILGPSSGGPNNISPDQIIGEVIINGVPRPLRATTSYFPMAVDQALVERSNRNRVSQLVQAFAYWAAREV